MNSRRPLPLLALAALLLACGDDPTDPVDGPRAFYVTVDDTEGVLLAAVLLSVDGPIEGVRVSGGWGLFHPDGQRTLVAVATRAPLSRIGFTLLVPGGMPTVDVLQVADGDDQIYPYPGTFTVEFREVEVQP